MSTEDAKSSDEDQNDSDDMRSGFIKTALALNLAVLFLLGGSAVWLLTDFRYGYHLPLIGIVLLIVATHLYIKHKPEG